MVEILNNAGITKLGDQFKILKDAKEYMEMEQLKSQSGPTRHILEECPKCKAKQRRCVHDDKDVCSDSAHNITKVPLSRRSAVMITSNNNKKSPNKSRTRHNTTK